MQLIRFLYLRLLGVVYLCAFLVALDQGPALIGTDGILPADDFLRRLGVQLDAGGVSRFFTLPTIFWWVGSSDATLRAVAWSGIVLAGLLVAGFGNAVTLFLLWALYLSIVDVGQLFWGYGWEILTLEAGFLAVFLVPVLELRPFSVRTPPPVAVMWLLRWLTFRVMFGAGLIKLRGDPCWTDLTCLAFHYETQPIPNPLSALFHHAPMWFHRSGAVFNHFAELVAPVLALGPRGGRLFAGVSIVAFQVILILSGNLSWLNWLTIAVAVSCFDDRALTRMLPARLRVRLSALDAQTAARAYPPVVAQSETGAGHASGLASGATAPGAMSSERVPSLRTVVTGALVVLVAYLSIDPVINMVSPRQIMNTSFDPFHLVNTYGAFGTIDRERFEIVVSGTSDDVIGTATQWREYEFVCKPGRVDRPPCIVSPYHERIDWQMWFAAKTTIQRQPWLQRFFMKLLEGDARATSLLAENPFANAPPRWLKADLYRYELLGPGSGDGNAWWRRTYVREYARPVRLPSPKAILNP